MLDTKTQERIEGALIHAQTWDTAPYELSFLCSAIHTIENEGRYSDVAEIAGKIDSSWFTQDHRRVVYSVITQVLSSEKPFIIQGAILTMAERLLQVSGKSYKAELLSEIGTGYLDFVFNSESFEKVYPIWKIKLNRQRLTQNAESVIDLLTQTPSIDTFTKHLPALIEEQQLTWSHIVEEQEEKASWADAIEDLLSPLPPDISIPTGIKVLDKTIQGGIAKRRSRYSGRLITLAGRPGMGKSTVAIHIASKIAQYNGDVVFFTLEMSSEQVMDKAIACVDYLQLKESGNLLNPITTRNMRERSYTADQIERLRSYRQSNLTERLHIYQGVHTHESIVSVVRLLSKTKERLSAVVIDYLQLLDGCEGDGTGTEASNIGKVTKSLKRMAKALGIDVLLLSQVNRGVEARQDKMPAMSDLRGSGRIEEDSDIVMFAMRPYYYDQGKDPYELGISVAKNRHGITGILPCCIDLNSSVVFDRALP